MKSPICQYVNIEKLTPDILKDVITRIEVGHVPYKAKPGRVIQIRWKFA